MQGVTGEVRLVLTGIHRSDALLCAPEVLLRPSWYYSYASENNMSWIVINILLCSLNTSFLLYMWQDKELNLREAGSDKHSVS